MSETIITSDVIASFKHQLEEHPVYSAVSTIEDLRLFMQHHVYSVWDFMSLIKYLQSSVAPSNYPWVPGGDPGVRRFINELVLEEESDESFLEGEFSSHFELYHKAMEEIGADTSPSMRFVERVRSEGVDVALSNDEVPSPSRDFTSLTFKFIRFSHFSISSGIIFLSSLRYHSFIISCRLAIGVSGLT